MPSSSGTNGTGNGAVPRRALGKTGFQIAPVAMGCWPIAGVTTLDTNEADSIATLQAAIDLGVNHLDTAYVYGPQGESETLIRRAIQGRRDEVVIATKGGIHFEGSEMVNDASPATLRAECEQSLARLGTDRVELYYLHSPDEGVAIEESAAAIAELVAAGKALGAGASNCTIEELKRFHAVCPLDAVQLPFNMLQRGIEQQTLPWCREEGISVMVYWPLMKGLLTGKFPRDHRFHPDDPRKDQPLFQGEEWQRNQDLLDKLRAMAEARGISVTELVVAWTIAQPGITAALCGAKRVEQINESAAALQVELTTDDLDAIDQALRERGPAETNRKFT